MKKLIVLILILLNCASNIKTIETTWIPLMEGISLAYDPNFKNHPLEMKLNNGTILKKSTWEGFLKDFVKSFPQEHWETILEGLTRYHLRYDEVEQMIKFSPVERISGHYEMHSFISLKGALKKDDVQALVMLQYLGDSWLFAEKVKIVTDNLMWEVRLRFYRNNVIKIWEYAFLNLNEPQVRKVLDSIIVSNKTIIRFSGAQHYFDLVVTNQMKNDLTAMLKVINLISPQKYPIEKCKITGSIETDFLNIKTNKDFDCYKVLIENYKETNIDVDTFKKMYDLHKMFYGINVDWLACGQDNFFDPQEDKISVFTSLTGIAGYSIDAFDPSDPVIVTIFPEMLVYYSGKGSICRDNITVNVPTKEMETLK